MNDVKMKHLQETVSKMRNGYYYYTIEAIEYKEEVKTVYKWKVFPIKIITRTPVKFKRTRHYQEPQDPNMTLISADVYNDLKKLVEENLPVVVPVSQTPRTREVIGKARRVWWEIKWRLRQAARALLGKYDEYE